MTMDTVDLTIEGLIHDLNNVFQTIGESAAAPGRSEVVQDSRYAPAQCRSWTAAREQHSGLGQYVVQSIVEQHGGTVTAANLLTGGAEFRMLLGVRE